MLFCLRSLEGWRGAALAVTFCLSACSLPPAAPPQQAATSPPYPGQPAAPGPLQIVGLRVNPDPVVISTWTEGYVMAFFNGPATQPGQVRLTGQRPGHSFYETLATERFVPGQTSVQMKFGLFIDDPGSMPIRATIAGQGDGSSYGGTVNFVKR